MTAAGASQEDIEEMMAMIMSAGSGGISEDFILAIKEAMSSGGNVFFNFDALLFAFCAKLWKQL